MNLNCGLENQWLHALVMLIVLAFEAWLGKTSKTKSGSSIELIFRLISALVAHIFKKEKKDG